MAGGIEPVGDPGLAMELLERVNGLNVEAAATCAAAGGLWAALPQDVAARSSVASLVLAALYFARGKIPDGGKV